MPMKRWLQWGAALGVMAAVAVFGWDRESPQTNSDPHRVTPTGAAPIAGVGPSAPAAGPPSITAVVGPPPGSDPVGTAILNQPPGVRVVSLEEQPLPESWKEEKRLQIRNLRETGSLSAGKVSHEFQRYAALADNLNKQGIDKIQAQLGITPTPLGTLLGPAFMVVGADATGKDIDKLGRAGFFQIHRNPTLDQMVELSELQYDVLAGDGALVTRELLNDTVGDVPATIEQLSDGWGAPLVNVQWMFMDRSFQLTTRNMTRDEARQLAQAVTARLKAMPFNGWRKAYEYDPGNFLHRTARPDTTPGRW